MPTLSEKLTTYIANTTIRPSTIARYLKITSVRLDQLLSGKQGDISNEGFSRLASETGIEEAIWRDEARLLPSELPTQNRRGRRESNKTPDFMRQQNLLRNRLREVINQKYSGSNEAFATAIGQSPSAVSHYLAARTVTPAFVLNVSKRTGISPAWLKMGEGSMNDDTEYNESLSADRHEGKMLGRYLDEHNISNRALGILMEYPDTTASSSVGQFRRSRQLKPHIKEKILNTLKVDEAELFTSKDARFASHTSQLVINGEAYPKRTFTTTVDIPVIPAHLRADFHYATFEHVAEKRSVTPYQLRRLQNPNLSEAKRLEIAQNYDILIIGDDYMDAEPAKLAPGVSVSMYRLFKGDWPKETGVMAVERTNGCLFIVRVRENTLSQSNCLTLTRDNKSGGSITVDGDQIVNMWKLETAIVPVI